MNHGFLIGAASSGSGKTTFTMGMLRALRRRNLRVQPYKCGPDYIDPLFHHLAAGSESVNLDTFLSSPEHVRTLFHRYGEGADVCVAEGVMGLFDGYDRALGSSGEVASLLRLPVVLLVNAQSTAYSVAPLIHGFRTFACPSLGGRPLHIAGVVFNKVGSERHFRFLQSACEDAGMPCFGYIPRNAALNIPSRHLGLTISTCTEMERLISLAAAEIEAHVDIASLMALECGEDWKSSQSEPHTGNLQIAVAHDEAFNFIYRANIDALASLGTVTESVRCFAEAGGRVFAECGGFMYLCRSIDGQSMCGVFPFEATMADARLHLGYRQLRCGDTTVCGHEFHYSRCEEMPEANAVYRYKNVMAGYPHWYWAETGFERLWNTN